MKKIENPNAYHWHNPLLIDLIFIKKYLRYPVNKKTIWPLFWIFLSLMLTGGFIFLLTSLNVERLSKKGYTFDTLFPFIVVTLMLLIFAHVIYKRLKDFRFYSIKTNFYVLDNIKLIHQFLLKNNISFYHNPDAPEVFQISSLVIDKETGQREIMVFIADDHRILFNSHFALSGNNISAIKIISTGLQKKIVADLKQWLKDNDKLNNHQFNLKITGN